MKNRLKWIVPLCLLAVLVLVLGECLIGLVWNLGMTASRIWLIVVILATCAAGAAERKGMRKAWA